MKSALLDHFCKINRKDNSVHLVVNLEFASSSKVHLSTYKFISLVYHWTDVKVIMLMCHYITADGFSLLVFLPLLLIINSE